MLNKVEDFHVDCFFFVVAHIIPGLLMLSVLLAGCNAPFAITVIMLSLGSNGAATITNLQNCQDLSPQFAGTLFGIANCIGSITGVLTPYLTSVFTKERVSILLLGFWQIHDDACVSEQCSGVEYYLRNWGLRIYRNRYRFYFIRIWVYTIV